MSVYPARFGLPSTHPIVREEPMSIRASAVVVLMVVTGGGGRMRKPFRLHPAMGAYLWLPPARSLISIV